MNGEKVRVPRAELEVLGKRLMGSWRSGAGRESVSRGIRKTSILTRAWSSGGTAGLEALWSGVFNRGLEGEIFLPGHVYMFTSRGDKPEGPSGCG